MTAIPFLQRHTSRFRERNLLLYALLGTVSVGRRFDRFVASLTSDLAATPRPKSSGVPPAGNSVYLMLGVVSLWRRIETEIASWSPVHELELEPAPTQPRPPANPRELLR